MAGGETVINPDGRQINLDQYASIIHENYEAYRPGPRTLRKMAAYPDHIIGSGFLCRAAEDEEPKLLRAMVAVIENSIKEAMG